MEYILKSIKKKKIPINPAVIISNNPKARGLRIAQKLGVNIEVIESKNFKGSRWDYDKKIISILKKYDVTSTKGLICLAGYMRIVSPQFVKKYKHRILNIHPAILPSFPGLESQKQALEYGVKYSGCTVHFVDNGVDTGPIILQSIVKVNDDDTSESLSKRILQKEHQIYSKAVELIAKDKIKISGRKTIIS